MTANMSVESIVRMVQVSLPMDATPLEQEVDDRVRALATAFGLTDEQREQVGRIVKEQRVIRMDTGYAIVDSRDHAPWINARKAQIDPFYWQRYEQWLQSQGWPPGVLDGLGRTTDEILDLLGNPVETRTWKRRGLVIGDVQSGKTATYSALICKAADAGYKFFVLLTGTIENLRRQTQERLDEGFVGFDSSEQLKRNRKDRKVGVGVINGMRHATVFTSSSADFKSATMLSLGLTLKSLNEPAIVVVKKNTKILANLKAWLADYNKGAEGTVDVPMLMIDDEADNASVNVNAGEDPTAVNASIRSVLALFRRTTYVGFTATPFANIFIDPESRADMLGDDLFPSNFIYALQAPTNYFGPNRLFLDERGGQDFLRTIEDVESCLPQRHKSTTVVEELPPSLVAAVHCFCVANAIRDLRGEGATHRSMLVNVSQYTNVQDQVERLLYTELGRIQGAIRNFSKLPSREALLDAQIAALHDAWRKEYREAWPAWDEVQGALLESVMPITTVAVNQRTGSRALDYKAYREPGLRVIAVGGNSLSRGLTLEGLCASYFRRNSQMYDTLLQMGRWFGYRNRYEDLCRVWLPQVAIDWYGHISEASNELKADVRRMYDAGRTPEDFGLQVRAHPDSLLITARNKMRTGREITWNVSISGQSFESVELPIDVARQRGNRDLLVAFVESLDRTAQRRPPSGGRNRFYTGVGRKAVADLVRQFRGPDTDLKFQPTHLADLLDGMQPGTLDVWDVVIPAGEGEAWRLGSEDLELQRRACSYEPRFGRMVVSKTKRRVSSRGIEKEGLTDEQKGRAEEIALQESVGKNGKPAEDAKANVSDRHYRLVRERPLLLLHFLEMKLDEKDRDAIVDTPQVAIALSFPQFDDSSERKTVKYRINTVLFRELYAADLDDEAEPDVVD